MVNIKGCFEIFLSFFQKKFSADRRELMEAGIIIQEDQ